MCVQLVKWHVLISLIFVHQGYKLLCIYSPKRFSTISASALKCWRCSSDASNGAFCDDTFDQTIINEQQRRWGYVECSHPPQANNGYGQVFSQRPVCKKVKHFGKRRLPASKQWKSVHPTTANHYPNHTQSINAQCV